MAPVSPLRSVVLLVGLVAAPALAATPAITAVSPASGGSNGGRVVTLTGTDLGGVTRVTFGGVEAAFTLGSGSSLTTTAPPFPAGWLVTVRATNADGTSAKTSANLFYYQPDPEVHTLEPRWGAAAGGDTLTLHGDHFNQSTAVLFECQRATGVWGGCVATTCGLEACSDIRVTSFTVVDDDTITVQVPAGMGRWGSRELWGRVRVEKNTIVSEVDSLEQYYGWANAVEGWSGDGPRLGFLGDSITAQAYDALHDAHDDDFQVSVTGRSGYRIAQLQPYADDLAAGPGGGEPPTAVVVNLGSNDAMQLASSGDDLYTIDDSVADLTTMVDTFHEADCVVLVTVFRGLWATQADILNAHIEALADEDPRIRVADWDQAVNDAGGYGSGWIADYAHPTEAGRDELIAVIDAALAGCPG